MEGVQSAKAPLHNILNAEQIVPGGYSTQIQAKPAAGYRWILAQNICEDLCDFLIPPADNSPFYLDKTRDSFDVWNDSQSDRDKSKNFAGKLEETDQFFVSDSIYPFTSLNPLFLLNGMCYLPEPCIHCGSYGLQYLLFRTTSADPELVYLCLACVVLAIECNFAQEDKCESSQSETLAPLIGHANTLSEEYLLPTETTALRSTKSDLRVVPNQYQHIDAVYDRSKHSSSRKTQRTRLLRAWLSSHQEHPYPTPEDTAFLSSESGLTGIQVTNWFSNARRSQRIPRLRKSFDNGNSPIPETKLGMTSSQRQWRQHSPLEIERRSSDAVISESSASLSIGSEYFSIPYKHNNMTSNAQISSNVVSESPNSASSSPCMRHLSAGKAYPPTPHPYKARKTPTKVTYQCTFCQISLKKKHDWIRHERSVHMPGLDSYTCTMPHGSISHHLLQVWRPKSIVPECALCGHPSPDEAHYKSHDFETCSERPVAQRTFSRKDHFWQHLYKYHNCRKWEGWTLNLDYWRQRSNDVGARCGFCGIWINTWDERTIHVEKHFKMGMKIDDWVNNKDDKKPSIK